MFELTFSMDNEAFADGAWRVEAARILRDLAGRIERGTEEGGSGVLFDVNGNRIGEYCADPVS